MAKNKFFIITSGLFVLFIGTANAFISQYRAEQSRLYQECIQDWSHKTLSEAQDICGIYLE